MKYNRFPLGHPLMIVDNLKQPILKSFDGRYVYHTCSSKHWCLPHFGVVKATYLSPSNFLPPVLPLRLIKAKIPMVLYVCLFQQN